jgi:hypothetical protein
MEKSINLFWTNLKIKPIQAWNTLRIHKLWTFEMDFEMLFLVHPSLLTHQKVQNNAMYFDSMLNKTRVKAWIGGQFGLSHL